MLLADFGWLIAFAVLLYLGVQNLNIVISTAKVLLSFLFPFIIGFGIAFILNVPMKFIEHHLFGKALGQKKKTAEKLARPISLVLSIGFDFACYVLLQKEKLMQQIKKATRFMTKLSTD